MKLIYCTIILLFLLAASNVLAQHHHGNISNNSDRKDPAIAALLSIQPLPVAIGNFYVGNWERGIIYSVAEAALFIPAAVLLGRNNWGLGMHSFSQYDYSDNRHWSSTERTKFYYLLTGYILVKVLSAIDAGYSAESFNKNISVGYDAKINSTILSLNIPVR